MHLNAGGTALQRFRRELHALVLLLLLPVEGRSVLLGLLGDSYFGLWLVDVVCLSVQLGLDLK